MRNTTRFAKQQYPPFPMTFWVHALIQLGAGLALFLLSDLHPTLTLLRNQGEILFSKSTWLSVTFVWVLFAFLLTELFLKLTQQFSIKLFPKNQIGFVTLLTLLVSSLLYFIGIALECMVFLAITGQYPIDSAPIRFSEGFGLTLMQNWPLGFVFLLGEILRQLLFSKRIKAWRNDFVRRRVPPLDV